MKRKFLIVLLAMIVAIVSAFTMAACDELPFPIGGDDSDNGSTVVAPGGDADDKGDDAETHSHSYNIVWGENGIKPTETETGVASMVCVICGDSKTFTVPELTDVTVWNLEESVKSDCLHCGKKVYSSTAYGKVTVELPLGDHDLGDIVPEVAPTGTKEGTLEHYTCSVCGKNFASDGETELESLVIPRLPIYINMTVSDYSINAGVSDEYIEFYVIVKNAEDGSYTLTTDHDELVRIVGDKLYVIADSEENVEVTVTARANTDETVFTSRIITVRANIIRVPDNVTITAYTVKPGTENQSRTLVYGEALELVVDVKNLSGDDEGYTLTISNPEDMPDLVAYDETNRLLTATVNVTSTVYVHVTITSTANPSTKEVVSIRVQESLVEREFERLSNMIREIANENVTVNGKVTDFYGTQRTEYEYVIKMSQTRGTDGAVTAGEWSSTWNKKGGKTVKSAYYKLGENDALLRMYIDKNNRVVTERAKNGDEPLNWSDRYLWNNLGYCVSNVRKFAFDDEAGAYRYNAEYGKYVPDQSTGENVYVPSADDNFLYYVALSMSVADERFYDFYVYLNDDGTAIDRIEANTYPQPIYATDGDGNATEVITGYSYTVAVMYFGNMGTTVVEEPVPYVIDATQDYYQKLTEAIEKAKSRTNFKFKTLDTVTYGEPNTGNDDGPGCVFENYEGIVKTYPYKSFTADMGYLGIVTEEAILLNRTVRYKNPPDDYVYRTEPYGYKQNSDGTFEEFTYVSAPTGFVGTNKRVGNISSLLPSFDVSPAIFQFSGVQKVAGYEDEFVYAFVLRDNELAAEVAKALCFDKFAQFAIGSFETSFTIIVDENANIVSVRFAYDVEGVYGGTFETAYYQFGTSELPTGTFDNYVAAK